MANLFDTINQNRQVAEQPLQVEDQTQRIQQLMRAKGGRASGGGAVAVSSLGEQAAVDAGNQALAQVGQQANVVAQQQRGQQLAQEQQQRQAEQEIGQRRKEVSLQNRIETERILKDLERDKGRLSQQDEQSKLELAASNMRMQNQDYMNQLEREGKQARLDDSIKFQEELTRQIFGDNTEYLKQALGNLDILSASDREFQKALARMGADDAWKSYQAESAAERQAATWTGAAGVAQAGLGAYGAYQDTQTKAAYKDYKAKGGPDDFESWEASR